MFELAHLLVWKHPSSDVTHWTGYNAKVSNADRPKTKKRKKRIDSILDIEPLQLRVEN